MAYPLDTTAQNAVLDAMLGDNAGASMPTSFEVALFNGHPLLGGTELTATGGYARVTVSNASSVFPDAVSGQKVSAVIALPTSTGAWSDTATHYQLIDHADSTTRYFPGRLLDEISITDTGQDASVQLICYWNTEGL